MIVLHRCFGCHETLFTLFQFVFSDSLAVAMAPGSGDAGRERCDERYVLTNGEILGVAEYPRVAWSYWDKGFGNLSAFRKLCVETWRCLNRGWDVIILDAVTVFDYLEVCDMPAQWQVMYVAFQSDAVRLALLAKYGGLWVDLATICVKPFDSWIYDVIRSPARVEDIGGFYFASWGVEQGVSTEYVENWVLAARRGHPLILAWKLLFNDFWNSVVVGTLDPLGLPEHPMFRNVDLTYLQRYGHDMRPYLVMHACFKKLIDECKDMRRMWQSEMLLHRADDRALWHVNEHDVAWSVDAGLRKWLGAYDVNWVGHVLGTCFVLKFTKQFANALDVVPRTRYLDDVVYPSSLCAVFRSLLVFTPVD